MVTISPYVRNTLIMTSKVFNLTNKKIIVAGYKGMVGSALVRRLELEDCEIIPLGRDQVDLINQSQVENYVYDLKADAMIVAAAKVGGILANNNYPADFLYTNLTIQNNLIHASHKADINRLLFLGSSCIYPKHAEQPIQESSLLTGPLEPTNECYAIAKIAGIKLCDAYRKQYGRSYISAMPTNIYGPFDNFDLKSGHVLASLMRRINEAKLNHEDSYILWGTGRPLREFMHSDDLADALIYLLEYYDEIGPINTGSSEEISILDLSQLIAKIINYEGEIVKDTSKPDGTPRKLMDNSALFNTGWRPKYNLRTGIKHTYQWYLDNLC